MTHTHSEQGIAHPIAIVSVAVVISVIGFAGYRVLGGNNSASTLNNAEKTSSIIELTPTSLEGIMPVDRARTLAVEKSQSSVVDLELGTEHGILVYKIDLSDGTRVLLNAKSGVKVNPSNPSKPSSSDDDSDDVSLPDNFALGITLEKAHEIAQAKFPAGKIQKIELDVEEGVVVYSVRFADKARVDVNAENGEIVRTKDAKSNNSNSSKANNSSSSNNSNAAQPATPSPRSSNNSGSSNSNNGSSNRGSGGSSGGSNSGSSNSVNSQDDDDELRVEGTLSEANGTYTVTQNGTTYTIQTSQNISGWVGKKVRAEGVLQPGNVIVANKVDLR